MKRRVDNLKNFGITNEVTVVGPGINGKMDEIRAAYGLLNLRRVDEAIEKRRKIAVQYRKNLKIIPGIRFFDDMPNVRHNYSYFPVFVNAEQYGMTRDELYQKLKDHNIYGRRYFYPLISTFSTYCGLDSASPENLPNATAMANSVICLPIHHELTSEDIDRITALIALP
jgi:dTDP-4-amino-4,6-dideoxygalactose transaminase